MADRTTDAEIDRALKNWRTEFPHVAYLAGVAADFAWLVLLCALAAVMAGLAGKGLAHYAAHVAAMALFLAIRARRKAGS
jgi:hypothetical protein